MKYIALLLLLTASVSLAEDRSLTTDGVFWKSLTRDQKLNFVIGYAIGFAGGASDTVAVYVNAGVDGKNVRFQEVKADNPAGITYGTLIDGMDKCYSDFENRRLDVGICMDWTVQGIRGWSEADRTSLLVQERKTASKQPQ
jgi:hypothetical protein